MGSFIKTRTEGTGMWALGSNASQQWLREGRDGPSRAAHPPPCVFTADPGPGESRVAFHKKHRCPPQGSQSDHRATASPSPRRSPAWLQLGWAAPRRPLAIQLDIKGPSKNKQMTSGAEGREVVPAGCLGSTSAIQSDPLGCEGNGRESIMGRVCLQKDVCGCDSSRSPRGGPLGTRVHHLGSRACRAPEGAAAGIQNPRPWAMPPRSQIAKVGVQDSVVSLRVPQTLLGSCQAQGPQARS